MGEPNYDLFIYLAILLLAPIVFWRACNGITFLRKSIYGAGLVLAFSFLVDRSITLSFDSVWYLRAASLLSGCLPAATLWILFGSYLLGFAKTRQRIFLRYAVTSLILMAIIAMLTFGNIPASLSYLPVIFNPLLTVSLVPVLMCIAAIQAVWTLVVANGVFKLLALVTPVFSFSPLLFFRF